VRRKTAHRRDKGSTAARKKSSRGAHTAASKPEAVAAKKKAFVPTAASITLLRKRCALSRSQFAAVLGVSPQTVSNWENHRGGRLKLQQRSMKALNRAWLRN